jgi:hypothetical protein
MLGKLCSEELHAAEAHEKVVKALLQASTVAPTTRTMNGFQLYPSALVLAEVVNVLMDIYGKDDRHPAVFYGLNLLGHFQRSFPLLNQKIAVEQLRIEVRTTFNSGKRLRRIQRDSFKGHESTQSSLTSCGARAEQFSQRVRPSVRSTSAL